MIIYSFIGKGGVGKTSSAAAVATRLAKSGKVLVISLDPAHNLGDVLDVELDSKPKEVAHNLYAAEPDVENEIKSFAKRLAEDLKSHYKYLKVFGLDKVLNTIEFVPGVEEQTLLELLDKYIHMDFDFLVVDHAPTGLALRVILMPYIMRTWLDKLVELRSEIVKRRKILAKMAGKNEMEDPVLKMLEEERSRMTELENIMKNNHKVGLVVNPEELPVLEAERAMSSLTKFGIPVEFMIVNKVAPPGSELAEIQKPWLEYIDEKFANLKRFKVPLLIPPPKGVERLRELAEKYIGDVS